MKERTSRPLASPTRQKNFEKWKKFVFSNPTPRRAGCDEITAIKIGQSAFALCPIFKKPQKELLRRAAENIVLKSQGASLFQVLLEGGESLKGAGDIFLQEKSPAPFKVFLNS